RLGTSHRPQLDTNQIQISCLGLEVLWSISYCQTIGQLDHSHYTALYTAVCPCCNYTAPSRMKQEVLMIQMLTRYWWVLALRGVAAIIFGILALVWPEITLLTLILVFGAYVLIDGIFSVIIGIRTYGASERWWASLLAGIAGII